jgi:hypothetical protein
VGQNWHHTCHHLTVRVKEVRIHHCDQVNDFPLIKGTPGIIHDPIDLLEVRFQTEVGIAYQYLQYAPPFVNEISIC